MRSQTKKAVRVFVVEVSTGFLNSLLTTQTEKEMLSNLKEFIFISLLVTVAILSSTVTFIVFSYLPSNNDAKVLSAVMTTIVFGLICFLPSLRLWRTK